jgi:LysM repeat protein
VPNPREDTDSSGSSTTAGQGGGGSSASAASGDTYIVLRGEVIDLIAAKHNVQVACLVAANPQLDAALRIYPGDEITIDSSCPPYDGEALNT